jgi:hypothetical protein
MEVLEMLEMMEMLHCHGIAEAISNRRRNQMMKVGHPHQSQMVMRLTMSPKAWRKAVKAVWWSLWCQTLISINEFLCPHHGMLMAGESIKFTINVSYQLRADMHQLDQCKVRQLACLLDSVTTLLQALNITGS